MNEAQGGGAQEGESQGGEARAGRSIALDTLRGLAIVGMLFSGIIPWSGLPEWMYHGQEPPAPAVQGLPRLTWVDLVFPLFLFAMGAAIPLATASRLARGESRPKLAGGALLRGLALVVFAWLNGHLRPYKIAASPTTATWLVGLLGFVLVVLVFVRLPNRVPLWGKALVRVAGAGGALLLVSGLTYAPASHIATDPADVIILVLATVSVAATWTYLASPGSLLVPLAIMATVVAVRLGASVPGSPAARFWTGDALSPYVRPEFLGYLLVALPGVIVGGILLEPSEEVKGTSAFSPKGAALAVVLLVPLALFVLLGVLFADRSGWGGCVHLGGIFLSLSYAIAGRGGRILRFGLFLVLLGLVLEPYQGGIKKDPPTLAYVVLTPGVGCLLLAALMEFERLRPRALRGIALTGTNPLLAYEAITNLIAPLWALTVAAPLAERLPGPAWGLARAALQTALFVLLVNALTRAKVVLRA